MKTQSMKLNQKMKKRALDIASYVLTNKETIRQAAEVFGVSKSTVHKDLNERLRIINPEIHSKVMKVLDYNFSVKHWRGGESTKMKHKSVG